MGIRPALVRVNTYTPLMCLVEARVTLAGIAWSLVDALSVKTGIAVLTFIGVHTGLIVHLEAFVTEALEGPNQIDTAAVRSASTFIFRTFIDVDATSISGEKESWMTLA